MADLPEEWTNFPCKPWTATSINFLDSYEVKAVNNARLRKKCYPVVLCCMVTGALHIKLSSDYGTDAFLCCYLSFLAIQGHPSEVYTDRAVS